MTYYTSIERARMAAALARSDAAARRHRRRERIAAVLCVLALAAPALAVLWRLTA